MRHIFRLLILLVLLGAAALAGWYRLEREMDRGAAASVPVRVQVTPGEGLRRILADLEQHGALHDARLVELYLRLGRHVPRIQAGTYEIAPHASARAVLEQLVAGRVVLEQLIVIEGWSFAQMRHALDAHPAVLHELAGRPEREVMTALGAPEQAAEGRFFPDTYRFAAGTSDRRILEQAYQRMQRELELAWSTRTQDLPLASSEQALILASIIEKETGREDERAKVAAVFVNRLRLGMRLQSDPTVIYGLGGSYDGDIHARDLVTDTPFNTYTRAGLPPTPIALPGDASLHAAMHPAPIDAVYFVATGNGDGTHHFSATLAEHDIALRAYLRKLGVQPGGAGAHSR
jgi:UPF0755 protein